MDIFSIDADALVNPVNCMGQWNAGLAKQFRQRYPKMPTPKLKIGELYVYRYFDLYIVNLPTKNDWRNKSKLEYIEAGLISLAKLEFDSIAIPKLGCGLGGLSWLDVKPLIFNYIPHAKICE